MKLQSGHEISPVEDPEKQRIIQDFEGYKGDGLVRLSPGRWLLPTGFQQYADKIYNFKFRSNDVVIMTWPKCGTSWTQEIIWTMRNNPNLDHPMAHQHVMARSPFLDADMLGPRRQPGAPLPSHPIVDAFFRQCPDKNPEDGVSLQLADAIPDPRTIKTHLPFSLLTPSLIETSKVVYVARNPKDVIISYHHHSRIHKAHGYVGSFDDFVKYFVDDDLLYGPYWLHLKEAWEKRNHPNLHMIFYEDLQANPLQELRKLNTFLGTSLKEKQLEDIVKYTSFAEMKMRGESHLNQKTGARMFNLDIVQKEGGVFRKGVSGDWKGKLTPNLEEKVDQWIRTNISEIGVSFKYSV